MVEWVHDRGSSPAGSPAGLGGAAPLFIPCLFRRTCLQAAQSEINTLKKQLSEMDSKSRTQRRVQGTASAPVDDDDNLEAELAELGNDDDLEADLAELGDGDGGNDDEDMDEETKVSGRRFACALRACPCVSL